MENYNHDYLIHHGTKGMKWGVRLYQNKDGSLTPLGQKRYNKEVESLKKEKAKVKAEEKVLANKKKTQAKFDKLEAEKKALEERKKALKEDQSGKKVKAKDKETKVETVEERRARVLNSSDPNEIYKNRDILSTAEINERLNRIDTERRLANVAESTKKTGLDHVNDAIKTFKKVDEIYNTVTGSSMGKDLAKKLGLNDSTDEFDLDKFVKNINKKSAKDLEEVNKRLKNEKSIMDEYRRRENKKEADAEYAKKQAEESAKSKKDSKAEKKSEKETKNSEKKSEKETYEGKVEGEGTSKSSIKNDWDNSNKSNSSTKSEDYYDPIDATGRWANDTSISNVPAVVSSRGHSYVDGYLEDRYGR